MERFREKSNEAARKKKQAASANNKKKFEDIDELPEADQQSDTNSGRKSNKLKTK